MSMSRCCACRGLYCCAVVPGDAAGEALVADLAVEEGGAAAAGDRFHRLHLHHRAFDVAEDVLVVLVLVVVRVHVDDQEILIVALPRLLARVLERLGLGVLLELSLRTSLRSMSMGVVLAFVLSDHDEDFVAAPDHIVLPELQLAVAGAFAGLDVVFVAVPGQTKCSSSPNVWPS